MRFALMRLGTGGVGRGLGRCRRGGLCGRTGRIAAVCSGRGLGGIAAQIPAFGLFDRIGAVVPMAARRRLSGGCWQTGIFRPHGMSAHAASGKNDQSTQNGKRSCFRQFPLASHVIASPSNHRPSAPTRRYSPRFRTGLKNIAAKTCYPAAVSTIFFCESRAIGLPGQASGPFPAAKTPSRVRALTLFRRGAGCRPLNQAEFHRGFGSSGAVSPRRGQDALEIALVAARNRCALLRSGGRVGEGLGLTPAARPSCA